MRPAPIPLLAPAHGGPVLLVFNRKSGKRDGQGDATAFRAAVTQACAEAGRPLVALEARRAQDLPRLAHQAVMQAQREGGVVVAAGGDGTINLVAQHVLQARVAMGVLPQGTFNYFSRTHGIPADTRAGMAVILQGRLQAVQAGLVNDQVFLVNASLGLYAGLIADRERAKARLGRSRWVALLAAVDTLWRGARTWELKLQTEQGEAQIRTTTVFVGNSALQLDQVGVPEAADVAHGALAGVALLPMSRLAMVGLAARAALARLAQAEAVQTFSFSDMVLSPVPLRRGRVARVAVDGEIRKLQFPLRFVVSPQPLWLMTPTEAADA
ncbi:diacylglycerol/lipid kinase family protein [Comamonas serinivorans]|uniref:diacylglycerol/lipid kinase family protein n=1 Tax=Comamonas serinivorans TaxID=1082851 RepID=UPI00146F45EA|nr:diacylglycerol kinase family protein [Comamonas serinivorans]